MSFLESFGGLALALLGGGLAAGLSLLARPREPVWQVKPLPA